MRCKNMNSTCASDARFPRQIQRRPVAVILLVASGRRCKDVHFSILHITFRPMDFEKKNYCKEFK